MIEALSTDPRTSSIPVVVVSVVDEAPRAKRAGAVASLLKPVKRVDLERFLWARGIGTPEGGVQEAGASSQTLGRIVLAEDNEQNIRTYASYLRSKGYEVLVARDGLEALELVRAERPGLVLMDIQMPHMDGLEVTRRIRSWDEGQHVPIVALTAMAMDGDRERCFEAGVDA